MVKVNKTVLFILICVILAGVLLFAGTADSRTAPVDYHIDLAPGDTLYVRCYAEQPEQLRYVPLGTAVGAVECVDGPLDPLDLLGEE